MLNPKLKAILLVGILVAAIGVPITIYAVAMRGNVNRSPVAVISGPKDGFTGMVMHFSAEKSYDPDGKIMLYIWDFGDGAKSGGKFVNHTYSKEGKYTVKLTVYDNSGSSSSTTYEVSIKYREERSVKVTVNDMINNPSKYIGDLVEVQGVFAYGKNYSFYMVNQSGYRAIRVYAEPGAKKPNTLHYGDVVKVSGRFTPYGNELEIKVSNETGQGITIVGHNGFNSYLSIPYNKWKEYNNSFVRLTGVVSNLYASYKYNIGNITVYVSRGANAKGSPAIGDKFEVCGFLTYYYSKKYGYGYHEMYVRNNTEDYSKYLSSSYINVSINDILSNLSKYRNMAIVIKNCTVNTYTAFWNFTIGMNESTGKSLRVYVENGAKINGTLFKGARISIMGTLVKYHSRWELKVRNATSDKIVVLSKPKYENVSVDDLLSNASKYNGTNVHSWGVISWMYHNSTSNFTMFGLFYNGSEIKVVAFNGSNLDDIKEGYHAEVYGQFTEYKGEWEIKIRPHSADHAVGTPQNYTDVNITAILKAPENYNNTLVHVPFAVITYVYNATKLFYVSNSSANTEDISVFVQNGAHIDTIYKGADVEIWGMVSQYRNKWEIKIRNDTNDTVKVINKINYVDVNITSLLSNASKYNGTNVHIPNATVVGVKYSYLFWISNSTNNSKDIAVFAKGAEVPNLGRGDTVEIYGNVSYHNGSYEIKVRSGTPDKVILIHSTAKYVNFSYIHEVDSNGTLVHLGQQVIVNGTVIAPPQVFSRISSQGKPLLKMYIEGSDGGVQVFGYNVNYSKLNLVEGDVVQVRGTLDQYNGEAELKVSSLNYIIKINHTSPITPQNITTGYFSNWTAAEKIEGTLVYVNGTVTRVNTTYHYFYVDDGSGEVEIFISASNVSMDNISVGDNVSVVGVVAQYDKTSPYTRYYEILPRYQSDIVKLKLSKVKNEKNKGELPYEVITIWKRRNIAPIAEDTLAH